MSLIKCPECGKEISDKANQCPDCGCPIKKMKKTDKVRKKKTISKKAILSVSIVLIIIAIGACTIYFLTENSRVYQSANELFDAEKYLEASEIYLSLEGYKDSQDKVLKCKYEYAKQLYEVSKYEEAKTILRDIGDYEDSKSILEECEYQLSPDVQFINDLANGLVKRWKLSDSVDEDKLDTADFKSNRTNLVNAELDSISKYAELDFLDDKLKENVVSYIDALNTQLEAIQYYGNNNDRYLSIWDEGYDKRALLIKIFVEDNSLSVEEEYQNNLDNFISEAKTIIEKEEQKEKVTKMMAGGFEKISSSYGWTTYEMTIENTLDVTFDYFSVEIKLIDEEGIQVGSEYTNSLSAFAPGDKAKLSFVTDVEFTEYEYIASWTIEE